MSDATKAHVWFAGIWLSVAAAFGLLVWVAFRPDWRLGAAAVCLFWVSGQCATKASAYYRRAIDQMRGQ